DRLLIGGAMMFTFLRAQGRPTGRSLVEEDRIETARSVMEQARARGVELLLPVDCVASTATDGSRPGHAVGLDSLGADEIGVDIGPRTVRLFGERLGDVRTVLWNGPMGIFEVPDFAQGTLGVARGLVRPDAVRSWWWEAGTRWRRCSSRASASASPISRPGAAPRSSSSRAR